MVGKYLIGNERVVYELSSRVNLDEDDNFDAYVTNQRLIFLRRTGFIFKKDRFVDILLKELIGATMNEEGFLFRKRFLELRTNRQNIRIYGKANDILAFHKRINEQLIVLGK